MVDYKFPRTCRLLEPSGFKEVFNDCKKKKFRLFTIFLHKNAGLLPRLGMTIAKRNIRKSHDRVRLKRLIRESFRKNKQLLTGLDIVIVVHREALHCANVEFIEILKKAWV